MANDPKMKTCGECIIEEECLRQAEQENGPRDQWREKVRAELMRDKPCSTDIFI